MKKKLLITISLALGIVCILLINNAKTNSEHWDYYTGYLSKGYHIQELVDALNSDNYTNQAYQMSKTLSDVRFGAKIYLKYSRVEKQDPDMYTFAYLSATEEYIYDLRDMYLNGEIDSKKVQEASRTFDEIIAGLETLNINSNHMPEELNTLLLEIGEENRIVNYYMRNIQQ